MRKMSSIQLSGLALLLCLVLTGITQLSIYTDLQTWLYPAALFFFGLNVIISTIFLKNDKKPTAAVNNMMISSVIRLFGSIAFLLGYFLLSTRIDKVSVIFFLFYYLFFMAFEIYYLVYNLRPRK